MGNPANLTPPASFAYNKEYDLYYGPSVELPDLDAHTVWTPEDGVKVLVEMRPIEYTAEQVRALAESLLDLVDKI